MFNKDDYKITFDWHTHTIYSDGKNTIEENVKSAVDKGLKSIAITDHGFNHFMYGVKRNKIPEMRNEIERLKDKYNIEILLGIEANLISFDGTIDLTDNEIKQFDIINMGLHRAVTYSKFSEFFTMFIRNYLKDSPKHSERLSQAYVKAMQKYPITTIAHLNTYKHVDVEPIVCEASKRNINIELNGKRTIFSPSEIDFIRKYNNKVIIDSDAHHCEAIGEYGCVAKFLEENNFPIGQIINLEKKNV